MFCSFHNRLLLHFHLIQYRRILLICTAQSIYLLQYIEWKNCQFTKNTRLSIVKSSVTNHKRISFQKYILMQFNSLWRTVLCVCVMFGVFSWKRGKIDSSFTWNVQCEPGNTTLKLQLAENNSLYSIKFIIVNVYFIRFFFRSFIEYWGE